MGKEGVRRGKIGLLTKFWMCRMAFQRPSQKSRPMAIVQNHVGQHIARDKEVERILTGAGIPLVRMEKRGRFEPKALARLVQCGIEKPANAPA